MFDVSIKQSQNYLEEDWWEWSIWVDGAKSVLDQIKYVEYTLHHTFRKPVRRIDDRESNFMLSTEGWGTFRIHVLIRFQDGTEKKLKWDLELHYPDHSPAKA